MLFNSIEYFIFLLIVLPLFFWLPQKPRLTMLMIVSYIFYGWWNAKYAVLVALSTIMDYALARRMDRLETHEERKRLLLVSLVVNLGLLFVFKYWNFANESMRVICSWFGLSWDVPTLYVMLPPGISFYTFQTLSYTIDVYRKDIPAEQRLSRFAVFIAYFPQLVAGPIERASNLLPQFEIERKFSYERFCNGLQQVLWGLFQKVVIADRLALYADSVYNNVGQHTPLSYLLGTYAFAFQIYCDFAGYSDIAIGSSRIMGYELMVNFDRPYFSTSITEFWRRWHISLSTWLRDYLYISLGGNRQGKLKTYRNLMITMVLGGLWHGASWNFVIWGGLQGVFLSLSRMTLPMRDRWNSALKIPNLMRDGVRMFVTFQLVCLSWVFFRANTFSDARDIVSGIGQALLMLKPWGAPFIDMSAMGYGSVGVVILLLVHALEARKGFLRDFIAPFPAPVRWSVWYAMILGILLLGVEQGSQFIYFQF